MQVPDATPSRTLSRASLALGTAAVIFVFGIGLCALVSLGQGWIRASMTPVFICGATSAFVGVLAGLTGVVGLVNEPRSRGIAAVGTLLGGASVCLFLIVLTIIRNQVGN